MYQKMYTVLCNAVTCAVENLREYEVGKALEVLMKAQRETEEIYISSGGDETPEA
ncbi:MAG: hypothetical protein HFF89_06700 [Oscillibacter sp.]|jgi:hypothetical protein|nr:hypothetical protein [Oscillibacter sp.]MCI8847932.1 hypothetical protein [Oscillibacter sp.]MCI9375394.1 hypothetical protein [Oscillibacter sp.]MCI9481806.1 hypothetical protein [Oscillibacter sp.]